MCPPTSTRCAIASSTATPCATARARTSTRAFRPRTMCGARAPGRDRGAMGSRARPPPERRRGRSSCSASASATSSSACSPPSATRATRCGCCSRSGFAPTHAFSAFYRWLREDFAAHAVLHFGTHGALEFMPGKQVGMSAACWPERLIGDLPNYLSLRREQPVRRHHRQASRRCDADQLSDAEPGAGRPLSRARSTSRPRSSAGARLTPETWHEREQLASLIQAMAVELDLAKAEPAWKADAEPHVQALAAAVLELEYTLIPHGMHVIGAPPEARRARRDADGAGRGLARQAAAAGRDRGAGRRHAAGGRHVARTGRRRRVTAR